jgi:hypothetical protein
MINQERNAKFRMSIDPELIKSQTAAQQKWGAMINPLVQQLMQQDAQETIDIEYEDVTDVKGVIDSGK